MANPLDWLLQSVAPPPSPLKYDDGQPSLTAYYPKPSERFEGWVHSLLGGGSQASLPHENFARGVPKLLEMTPLGIGLSAADLVRAKWDNDPMGAAAAAIGMIPGAGKLAPEARSAVKALEDPTAAALKAIEEILGPAPVHAPGPDTPYLMGGPANPANSPINVQKQTGLLNNIPQEQNWDKYFELQNAALQKMTPKGQVTHAYNPQTGMWEVFDPHGPANAFVMSQHQSMAEAASAAAKINNPPAAKPIYDYEKDDNGLYHIFDAVSGKTVKIVDSHKEAKDWIANPGVTAQMLFKQPSVDLPGNKAPSIPAHPPWLDQSAVLPEDAREAARLAGDYTTPAWRGIRVEPGKDVGTVFQGDEMFSSANPKLADMYASSLSKHPGANPSQHSYLEGASGMPFWINTNDYHVADAGGQMWSDFNWKAIKEAKDAGKKGVVIHNVWDEPHSTKNLGAPNTIYITFPEGLSTVKSKFAGQFNPNSKDIAKSILATLGVGSTAYPFLQEDNRK